MAFFPVNCLKRFACDEHLTTSDEQKKDYWRSFTLMPTVM